MREIEVPDNCTLCGGSFEFEPGKSAAFPYPPNHFLCRDCLIKASDEGLNRLNKRLAGGDLDLSVEEIAHEVGVRTSNNSTHKEDE